MPVQYRCMFTATAVAGATYAIRFWSGSTSLSFMPAPPNSSGSAILR